MNLAHRSFAWLAVLLPTLVAACSTASPSSPLLPDGDASAPETPDAALSSDGGPTAIRLSGCGVGPTVDVTLGGAQSFKMLIDTGSTTTGIASSTCQGCKEAGLSPLYERSPGAVDRARMASALYASVPMVGWSGPVLGESALVTGAAVGARVDLVAIDTQSGFFDNEYCGPNAYEGILGLGRAGLALPGTNGYLDQLAGTGVPDILGLHLCPTGGEMWLGGFDPKLVPVYTPMSANSKLYTVVVSDLELGETSLGLPKTDYGDAFVDTGGSSLWLPPSAFAGATTAIGKDARFVELFGEAASFFDPATGPCTPVKLSKAELDAALPPLTLVLGAGASMRVRSPATESYLTIRDSGLASSCVTSALREMKGRGNLPPLELGATFLQGKLVVIDRAASRIGFAPAPCP